FRPAVFQGTEFVRVFEGAPGLDGAGSRRPRPRTFRLVRPCDPIAAGNSVPKYDLWNIAFINRSRGQSPASGPFAGLTSTLRRGRVRIGRTFRRAAVDVMRDP